MRLDEFYDQHINRIKDYCNKYKINEDHISNTYFRLRKTLISSGLTEQDYFNIIRRSVWNSHLDEKQMLYTRKTFNYVDDKHKTNQIETALRERDEWDIEGKQFAWELEYLTRMLFKYIDTQNYSEMEVFIFKSYAISQFSYKEINEKFGITIDTAKNIMRKFRKDLRANFLKYVDDETKQAGSN